MELPVSPQVIHRVDALWTELAHELPTIEAITFHEATAEFPAAWAIAFEGGDILLVDALPDPDRLVFSMILGDVPPDQRLEMYETVLRVNAWLATQDDVVGGIVLSGQQIVLKGQQRIEGLDRDALRRAVLDIQGAAHAWWYFLQTRERPDEAVVLDACFERV